MNRNGALATVVFLAALALASTSRADVSVCMDYDGLGGDDDRVFCPLVPLEEVPAVIDPTSDVAACGEFDAPPGTTPEGMVVAAGCIGTRVMSFSPGIPVRGCVLSDESDSTCRQNAILGCLFCGCAEAEIDAAACGGDADCSDPASTHDADGDPCDP